jgi:hypothetical protein
MAYKTQFEKDTERSLQKLDEIQIMAVRITTLLNVILDRMDASEIRRAPVCKETKRRWLAEGTPAKRLS